MSSLVEYLNVGDTIISRRPYPPETILAVGQNKDCGAWMVTKESSKLHLAKDTDGFFTIDDFGAVLPRHSKKFYLLLSHEETGASLLFLFWGRNEHYGQSDSYWWRVDGESVKSTDLFPIVKAKIAEGFKPSILEIV